MTKGRNAIVLTSRDKLGYVFDSACGSIHVVFGQVELKFTSEGLLGTYQMLGEAVARLEPRASKESHIKDLASNGSKLRTN